MNICIKKGTNVRISYIDPMQPTRLFFQTIVADKEAWFVPDELNTCKVKSRGRRRTQYSYNFKHSMPLYKGKVVQFMSWIKQ